MPRGFWYASGPYRTHELTAASAFSQGDLIALSTSSASRVNPFALTTGTLFGVAASDSTNSINGKCVIIEATPQTRFWSRTTVSITLGKGAESGVSFVAASPGRYFVDGTSTTNSVVVDEGVADVDQSVQSKMIVRFKYADSELDLA